MTRENFQIVWNVVCIVIMAGISTIAVQEYFLTFFEKKKKSIGVWVILVAYFFWQIVSMKNLQVLSSRMRLCISVIFVVVLSVTVVGSLVGKLVFAIIYNAIWMFSETIIGCLFIMFHIDYLANELYGSILSKMLLLLLIKVLQRFFSYQTMRELSWKNNAMLILLPMGSMFIVHYSFVITNKLGREQCSFIPLVFAVIVLIVNVIMFHIYI